MSALGLLLWLAGFAAVGLLVRSLRYAGQTDSSIATKPRSVRHAASQPSAVIGIALLGLSGVGTVVVWSESRSRPLGDSHSDIAALWLLSIAVAIVGAAWPISMPSFSRVISWIAAYKWEIGAVCLVTILAIGLRVFELDRYPRIFNSDEANFTIRALEVLDGTIRNPFMTGWLGHPTLWYFLEAPFLDLFGRDVSGARMLGALMGAATVPLTYLFVRRNFGVVTGLATAALLSAFHIHLYWSRDALNNVSTPFFVIVVLLFMDRVASGGGKVNALAAGLAVGLAQYGYQANSILVALTGAYLIYMIASPRPRSIDEFTKAVYRALVHGLLVVAGFMVAIAPFAAFGIDHRPEVTARFKLTSIFTGDWLEAQIQLTGDSVIEILFDQLKQAALLPFTTEPTGYFYRADAPFVGWPLVVPTAIGIVVATIWFTERRYFGLVVAYWGTLIGVAQTTFPADTNRSVMMASLLPIFAAIGLAVCGQFLVRIARFPRELANVAIAAAVIGCVAWNVQYYYDDSDPLGRWTDPNTLAANTFAYEMKDLGPGYTIYYAAPPRMLYGGHANLPFIANGNVGMDVVEPWDPVAAPPVLTGPTVFFFLPERRTELAVIQEWFPGGELHDETGPDNEPLFTTYRVLPAGGAG